MENVLSEVHKKIADAKNYLGLITTLRKLRNFRLHEAEVKGVLEMSSYGTWGGMLKHLKVLIPKICTL